MKTSKDNRKKKLTKGLARLAVSCLLMASLLPANHFTVSAAKAGALIQETGTNPAPSPNTGQVTTGQEAMDENKPATDPSVPPAAAVAPKTVGFTPYTITKGNYVTPIWNQHVFWKKRSSAARHGCGICVTAMALNLSGIPANPNTVLKETKRSQKRCASLKPPQALKAIKKHGLDAVLINTKAYSKSQNIAIMKNALDNGKLVMALVRGKPFSGGTHWVLLTGYDTNGLVVVANSSNGNRKTCLINKKQYHLVTWKQIQKKLIRDSKKYSAFIIVG